MHKVLKKILQILDGTPAEYGSRSRGQSVVELALVTPILIVLIMGLVEIGWFANNYLILLESTRTGARFGTVQTGTNSPLAWNNDGSLVPAEVKPFFPEDEATDEQRINVRNCGAVADENTPEYAGFYSLLNCVVLRSMDPLEFHGPDKDAGIFHPDDIVISAFALQLVDPRTSFWSQPNAFDPSKTNGELLATIPGIDANMPRVLVVGRFPTNANECTVNKDGDGEALEPRDPFDYIQNGQRDFALLNPSLLPDPYIEENMIFYELDGRDDHNLSSADTFERQRGFSYVGQHYIGTATGPNVNCIGSEWTVSEVERLINLPSFDLKDAAQRSKLASMGMVLVEMFWRHDLLLKNPVFNPVFTILGDNTIISVWAAFPVPAVEPRIRFPN